MAVSFMGFYSRHVFPRLCDWAMRKPHMARLRREVLTEAGGCRLDVDIEALVRSETFREASIERFLLEATPRVFGSMYRGVAVR
jgi:hypothetical protein